VDDGARGGEDLPSQHRNALRRRVLRGPASTWPTSSSKERPCASRWKAGR
jgi:hypothetical protein